MLPESVKSRNNNNSDEKNRIREEMDGSCIRNWEQLCLERKANENKKLLEKYKYNCANNAKSKGLLNNYNKKVFDFRSNFVKFMILKYIKKWCNYLKIM